MVIHYYEQSIKTNETVSVNPLERTKIGRYTDGQQKIEIGRKPDGQPLRRTNR